MSTHTPAFLIFDGAVRHTFHKALGNHGRLGFPKALTREVMHFRSRTTVESRLTALTASTPTDFVRITQRWLQLQHLKETTSSFLLLLAWHLLLEAMHLFLLASCYY